MRKVLGVVAAFAIAGVAGVANAADAQDTSVNQPVEISAVDMDNVTAGLDGATVGTRTKVIGNYTYFFDGSRWTRTRNK